MKAPHGAPHRLPPGPEDRVPLRRLEELEAALEEANVQLRHREAILDALMVAAQTPFLAVDREYRYTCFNQAHAAAMKALYGAEISLGACMLDCQTVPEDRAQAKARIDRALAGETFTEQGESGEETRSQFCFEITHTPVRGPDGEVTGDAMFVRDLTSHLQVEAVLKTLEARTSVILQTTHDGVWLVGADGRIENMNESACRMAGYSREELLGRHVADLEARETPEEVREHLERIQEVGSGLFESLHRRKDGSCYPVEVSVTATPGTGQMIAFVRDITRRHGTLEALRRTTDLLAQAEAIAGVGGWELDLEAQSLYWTEQTYRIHDLDPESHTPTVATALQFYAPEWQPVIALALQETIETGHGFDLELELVTAKGRRVWVRANSQTIQRNGRVVKVLGAFRDITEQKLAEDALSESERRYRLISENTEDVIWVMDVAQGRLTYVSPAVRRLRGFSPEEILSRPLEWDLTPESHQRVLRAMAERIPRYEAGDEACRVGTMRVDQPCRDGSTVPTEVVTTLLKDARGRVTQVLGVTRDLRLRLEAERLLANSERRHRAVFETSADGLALVDRETLDILDANPAFCAMYGYTLDELRSMKATDLSAEPEATLRAVRDGARRVGHRLHRRKDGSIFPIELVADVFEEGGRTLHVISVRDITEQIKVEEALRTRVDQLQIMLELAALPDCHSGKELLKEGLERAVRISGSRMGFLHLLLEDQDMIEFTAWTAEDPERCSASYDTQHPLSSAGVWSDAARLRQPLIRNDLQALPGRNDMSAGRFRITRELVVPVVESGKVRMLVGVANKPLDYDELDMGQLEVVAGDLWKGYARQRAVTELGSREASLRATFDQALVGIAHLGFDGRLLRVNHRFAEILDRKAEEMVGMAISSITHPENQLPPGASAQDILRGMGGGLIREARYLKPDGTPVWVQVLESLVSPGATDPGYILKVVEDITDRKRMESQIQELNRGLERRVERRTHQLEAANQELEAFAYSVSHDLRAPLRSVAGFAEALARDPDSSLSPKALGHLERIQGGADRMAQLIEDLLKLSRVGRDDFLAMPLDLGALAEEVLKGIQAAEPERKANCLVERPIHVLGDPRLLRLLLENLLGNAWKFTSRTLDAHISVASRPLGQTSVAISVRDNGAGFPSSQAGRLFTPFQRLHKAEEFSGSGIGLAIAKRIVSRHGGVIRAEGEPGHGAVVHFTLPMVKEEMP